MTELFQREVLSDAFLGALFDHSAGLIMAIQLDRRNMEPELTEQRHAHRDPRIKLSFRRCFKAKVA